MEDERMGGGRGRERERERERLLMNEKDIQVERGQRGGGN